MKLFLGLASWACIVCGCAAAASTSTSTPSGGQGKPAVSQKPGAPASSPLPSQDDSHRQLSENSIAHLQALKTGDLLVASRDPFVGVRSPSGSAKWAQSIATADFANQARTLRLSGDATVVEFELGRGRPGRVTFDIRALRRVETGNSPPLGRSSPDGQGIDVTHWENLPAPLLNGRQVPVKLDEVCRALSVDWTKRRFLLVCDWQAYLFDDAGRLKWQLPMPASARAGQLSTDGRLMVVALQDGTLRWLNAATGQPLVVVLFEGATDWVAWTPSGFFTGTARAEGLLGVHIVSKNGAAQLIPMLQFADLMRRPDLVATALDTPADAPRLVATIDSNLLATEDRVARP